MCTLRRKEGYLYLLTIVSVKKKKEDTFDSFARLWSLYVKCCTLILVLVWRLFLALSLSWLKGFSTSLHIVFVDACYYDIELVWEVVSCERGKSNKRIEVRGVRWRKLKAIERNPQEFTIFVDNLPLTLDWFGLKGIFEWVGKVWDNHILSRIG